MNRGLSPATYCFSRLKFKFKAIQVTPSGNPMIGVEWGVVAATRAETELFECSAQAQVEVETSVNGALEARSFFIQFYK